MENLDKYKKVMFRAAHEAAGILLSNFNTNFKISRKKFYNDLVTEVDKKSEDKIIEIIHSSFPDHNILSEEVGDLNKDSEYVWIVDPLDGTVNYAHSVPIYSISIALEIKKKIQLGLIYNPVNGERFFAQKGKGAFLNDKKIRISNTKYLKDALLVTGFPYGAVNNPDHALDHFNNFLRHGVPVRRLGSAALDMCFVACGRFDGFWEVSLNPWDVAAGYLILKEAGGKISNFKGENFSVYSKQLLATNGKIHKEMMDVLALAYKE
jgi:myo-inositol-1(or 4)-monophosphatase